MCHKLTQPLTKQQGVVMTKNDVLKSLEGENVTVYTLDREETEYHGELIEISSLGATLKSSSHGRDFFEFLPMTNINSISHKILDTK